MKQAIIIIGGFNSVWPAYLKMARDLEDLSGSRSVGVPLMPWDWWRSGRARNATIILEKLDETVAWALRKLQAERLVLVGHSAGGVVARLYLSNEPVWGQSYSGRSFVSMLITLGSPHCSHRGSSTGWYLTDLANRLVPGLPAASTVYTLSVAGRQTRARAQGSHTERRAYRSYSFFGGEEGSWGDGIIPVACARLAGAEDLIVDGVAHSRKVGRDWYGGSKPIIRSWWPGDQAHDQ
jgi:pimeloyl-ACP methyl ester carboxylesterase